MKIKEIKREVKNILQDEWIILFIPVVLMNLFNSFVSEDDEVMILFFLISLLLLPILNYGIRSVYIKKKNDEDVGIFDFLKDGFSNFLRAWKVSLRLILKYMVPILLMTFSIVTTAVVIMNSTSDIINQASQSIIQQQKMLEDSINEEGFKPTSSSLQAVTIAPTSMINNAILTWFANLATIIAFISAIPLIYKYRYAYNEAILNPEISAKEAVENSGQVMKGNKFKSFLLDLSYIFYLIGIILLATIVNLALDEYAPDIVCLIVVASILAFFTMRITLAHVIFYEDKRIEKENENFLTKGGEVIDNYSNPIS